MAQAAEVKLENIGKRYGAHGLCAMSTCTSGAASSTPF
jgi:hypothetical protein